MAMLMSVVIIVAMLMSLSEEFVILPNFSLKLKCNAFRLHDCTNFGETAQVQFLSAIFALAVQVSHLAK